MATEKDNKNTKPVGKPAGKTASGKSKGVDAAVEAAAAAAAKEPPRLKVLFDKQVRAKLASEFGLKNPMQHPRMTKIVININMGRHLEGTKIPVEKKNTVLETITKVTGQKPVVIRAKKSVSNFKLREGYESSAMVTLRRDRMWQFLDRFIHLASPRIKDFRGLPEKAFDKQGSYAFGLQEQGVFPEINMAEVNFTHGMNINICFAGSTPDRSRFVLEQLGFPFRKPEEKISKPASAPAAAPAAPKA
ncbi:MAG: 50S ribosomal protein L5 [Planctomycetes bacterium]|nr:50S ribosomal protein L5 [Planctomycetota bacterium]